MHGLAKANGAKVVQAAPGNSPSGPTPASERVESEGYPGARAVPCIQSIRNEEMTKEEAIKAKKQLKDNSLPPALSTRSNDRKLRTK